MSAAPLLPVHFFRLFLDVLSAELGPETLSLMLAKGNLPGNLLSPQALSRFTSVSAAETYAAIQKTMRVYYGRGARGTLTRTGRILWGRLLENAFFAEKAQAQIARNLPPALRPKATIELLAHFLREKAEGVTIHTLDMDLMLVDHAAAATVGQQENAPICSVTMGLIEEALFWASGREHNVDEVSCHAVEGEACEFKITIIAK